MTKQCGNCKWWDAGRVYQAFTVKWAECMVPFALSDRDARIREISKNKSEYGGRFCPVYEERKE